VKLDTNSPVTIVGSQQRLARARELAHAIVNQLVYHHSPEDVRIISVSPLKRPELTLALSRNTLLGVSVLCVCANAADVPTTSGVMIDLDAAATPQGMTAVPISNGCQALILTLQPDPPPTQTCDVLDSAPLEVLRYFALRMQHVRAANTKRLELRTQVDLRALFEPVLDLGLYEPYELQ